MLPFYKNPGSVVLVGCKTYFWGARHEQKRAKVKRSLLIKDHITPQPKMDRNTQHGLGGRVHQRLLSVDLPWPGEFMSSPHFVGYVHPTNEVRTPTVNITPHL